MQRAEAVRCFVFGVTCPEKYMFYLVHLEVIGIHVTIP
jgi:hypothetical protein